MQGQQGHHQAPNTVDISDSPDSPDSPDFLISRARAEELDFLFTSLTNIRERILGLQREESDLWAVYARLTAELSR